jgi:iodotyrosine deiodinase
MAPPTFVPLEHREYPPDEMKRRATAFYADVSRRRSVRQFSDRPVPREVIDDCLRAAGTAPSGANQQPWHFVVVGDPAVKRRIREAAESRERDFYERRAPQPWLEALRPLGTGPEKPFLEDAPYLIVVFLERFGQAPDGSRTGRYYPAESAAIATGVLITALHHAGLASLPYTPVPMGFLNSILDRPDRERPLLVLVTGYPAPGAVVPRIDRKPLGEIATFV